MKINLLTVGFTQLGVKEIAGPENNLTIVNYAKEVGINWVNDDETPWCMIFAMWMCKRAGQQYLSSALARNALNIGRKVSLNEAKPGLDLVVFWRGSKEGISGHVAAFLGFTHDQSKVFVLGGNQANQVSVAAYDTSKILGIVRVGETEGLEVPSIHLEYRSTGQDVKDLQEVLEFLGFYKGKLDGDYGPKTKQAVIAVQASGKLLLTGDYDASTYDYIVSLMQQ